MCCHKDVFCQTDKHIADIQTLQHYRKSGFRGGRQVPRLTCFQEQVGWGPRLLEALDLVHLPAPRTLGVLDLVQPRQA